MPQTFVLPLRPLSKHLLKSPKGSMLLNPSSDIYVHINKSLVTALVVNILKKLLYLFSYMTTLL